MSINQLKDQLPDYLRDIKLNLGNLLTPEGAPGLTFSQIAGIVLASSYATQKNELIEAVKQEFTPVLTAAEIQAAKTAASLMAMNNVYYRFIHLVSDKEYSQMPAKLRMNAIGNPGIPEVDFELYSLAVSAINGCGMCIESHAHQVNKAGVNKIGVQSTVRIN